MCLEAGASQTRVAMVEGRGAGVRGEAREVGMVAETAMAAGTVVEGKAAGLVGSGVKAAPRVVVRVEGVARNRICLESLPT